MRVIKCSIVQTRYTVCKTYRDSNKRDPHANLWTYGRTVVSRLTDRCTFELRATDTGKISDNTKTTRQPAAKCQKPVRNGTRTSIFFFFFAVAPTLCHHRAPSTSSLLPWWFRRTRRTEHARIWHISVVRKACREHIFTFFSSHDQFNEPPSFKCAITSLELFISF